MPAVAELTTPHATRATFRESRRVLTSVLAPLENRLLIWIAARVPRAINSDHLTGLAVLAMAAAGAAYWQARAHPLALLLVDVCLVVNWLGDSLDGTLARVRGQQRPRFGFYVDHMVDCIGAALLFGGLAASGFMTPVVAISLLAAFLLLSAETYLATYCVGTFRISHFGAGPTELRMLLAMGNLVLLVKPKVDIGSHVVNLFDVGGTIGIAGLALTTVVAVARNTRALHRAEPRPQASPAQRAPGGDAPRVA